MKNILHIIIINYAKYYWTLKSFAIIFHIFLIPVIQSWEELMQSNIGHFYPKINYFIPQHNFYPKLDKSELIKIVKRVDQKKLKKALSPNNSSKSYTESKSTDSSVFIQGVNKRNPK